MECRFPRYFFGGLNKYQGLEYLGVYSGLPQFMVTTMLQRVVDAASCGRSWTSAFHYKRCCCACHVPLSNRESGRLGFLGRCRVCDASAHSVWRAVLKFRVEYIERACCRAF